jgi:polyhydroxybutyrate depolymerase
MSRSLLALLAASAVATAADPRRMDWTVDGTKREATVYAPDSAKTKEAPVVFAFHGHGGSMANAAKSFAVHTQWPEAVVVYMQGLPTPGKTDPDGKQPGWQISEGDQKDRDLKFFDEVLATLKKEYKVDPKRVYAMGHSNGGAFTYLLWAARGEAFAAVAPSAAGNYPATLRKLKPKPALHVAGEADEIVPFAGQKRTMDFVKKLNGCAADGKEYAKGATAYPSESGTPFVAMIHPGGHKFLAESVPVMVKFFQDHPAK